MGPELKRLSMDDLLPGLVAELRDKKVAVMRALGENAANEIVALGFSRRDVSCPAAPPERRCGRRSHSGARSDRVLF